MTTELLNTLTNLYDELGHMRYGEDVSQSQHAMQCAELAIKDGASEALIIAALLHDIGHLLEQTSIAYGNYRHDKLGAEYLSHWLPPEVTEPIRLHAQAKRYLCATVPNYYETLSAASKDSLANQGGVMSNLECLSFEKETYFKQAVQLRRWDDEGKDITLSHENFSGYLQHLQNVVPTNQRDNIV
ncbi:HD domain-containing protein [Vibrio sp. S4M6]|uniref:HD domain-containing protein n=1 Tax=Vibrio sinus TaxID=2946865 RepID=UPI00202A299B|nr:HD domain-containing protein [Vibrio sinus]MCL9780260.1 HD domain-containing protein [Vibrio sinus]